jgi:hypothetical protein
MDTVVSTCGLAIYGYCPFIDILALTYVSKLFSQIPIFALFKIRLIQTISETCKIGKTEAKVLLDNITGNCGVISGSIMLKVIYGEDYGETDIDIFFLKQRKGYPGCHKIMTDIFSLPSDIKVNQDVDDTKNVKCFRGTTRQGTDPLLYTVVYSEHDRRKYSEIKYMNVEVVEMNVSSSLDDYMSVTTNFDRTIVKNTYSAAGLQVHNVNMLIYKISEGCAPGEQCLDQTARNTKYANRGFLIIPCYGKYGQKTDIFKRCVHEQLLKN